MRIYTTQIIKKEIIVVLEKETIEKPKSDPGGQAAFSALASLTRSELCDLVDMLKEQFPIQ